MIYTIYFGLKIDITHLNENEEEIQANNVQIQQCPYNIEDNNKKATIKS